MERPHPLELREGRFAPAPIIVEKAGPHFSIHHDGAVAWMLTETEARNEACWQRNRNPGSVIIWLGQNLGRFGTPPQGRY